MDSRTLLILVSFLLFLLFPRCNKESENEIPDDLVYHSLVAEKDTIAPGETVNVKATATGSQLEYFWSATPYGDILNSGSEVLYAASPCGVGTNKISCKITNGSKQEETKTIDIVVYE
jgi:hypothetical protein